MKMLVVESRAVKIILEMKQYSYQSFLETWLQDYHVTEKTLYRQCTE